MILSTIGMYAFGYCDKLSSVTLPEGLLGIGQNAFRACYKLKEITIPDSVTKIYSGAFQYCTGLTTVKLPSNLTSIPSYCFQRCSALTSLELPVSLTEIGSNAFSESGLTAIDIPGNVTSIGQEAFSDCTALEEIYIPDSVTEISHGFARGCTALESVYILDGVTTIGWYAFEDCTKLNSVRIPESVTSIGVDVFVNTAANLAIHGYEGSYAQTYAMDNGFTFIALGRDETLSTDFTYTIEDGEVRIDKYNGSDEKVVVPYAIEFCQVTKIGDGAFKDNTTVTSVNLPETIRLINMDAFNGCTNLEEIRMPGKIDNIGDYAFNGCASLKSITLPAGIQAITEGTFRGCAGLTEIVIPEGVLSIELSAFFECAALESATLPEGLKYIGNWAFNGCSSLTQITIPETVQTIGELGFYGTGLTEITLPKMVTSLGKNAFMSCDNLETVNILGDLACIDENTFYWCTGLKTVSITGSVQSIARQAFYNCENLTSVTLPDSITSIGDEAFRECVSMTLTNTTLPANLKTIGASSFYRCQSLTEIVIPEGVTSIGEQAFVGCTNLTKITIPASVTEMGKSIFAADEGLTIYGYSGSTAETYAAEYSITFVSLDAPKVPVVQFANAQVAAAENLAFELFVNAENWTTSAPLTISMTTTDANLDIINTKFTSASQTLVQLGQSGAIYATASGSDGEYSNTTSVPNSTSRTFYIQAGASSTPLYISGNYQKGNTPGRSVTLTLQAPSDGSYTVGANSSCTIIYNDVDASMPTDRTMTRAQWMAACTAWFEAKYPSGRNWNHLIGAVNAVDNITAGACHDDIHVSGTNAIRSTSWDDGAYNITLGARICNGYTPWPSAQCMGFALKVASDAFGSDPKTGSGWTTYSSYSAAGGLQAGDYVRISGHSFFVLDVTDTTAKTLECNMSDVSKCVIFRSERAFSDLSGVIEEICRYNWPVEDTPVSPYTYTVSGAEATITGYNGTDTVLTIPSSLDGYPVTAIGESAFSASSLTSVTIPEGVKIIGRQAFYTSRKLASVTFPTTIEEICSMAFVGCDLESLYIPSGLIGEGAFGENMSLTEVEFGTGVTALGSYVFENCMALEKVTIPKSVVSMGGGIFGGCSKAVIYGYTNSLAQSYAEKYSVTFVALDAALPDVETLTAICPWSAGSVSDSALRAFGSALVNEAGVGEVTYSNLTGAGGVIGHQAIADAAADGKTLGMITTELSMYAPMNTASLTYASVDPLCILGINEASVLVNAQWAASNGITDMSSFIAYCTANPASVRMAVSSAGSVWHMAGGYLEKKTGVDLSLMNYADGAATSIQNAALGMDHGVVTSLPNAAPFINSGDLICLGVMGTKRNDFFPTYETCSEQGYALVYGAWYGIAAPKGLDASMKAALEACCKTAAQSESFASAMAEIGFNLTYMGANEAVQFLSQNYTDTYEVITALGL